MKKAKRFDPTQIAIDMLNKYTKPTRYSEGWDFPIGLIGDIENAINDAFLRGTKKGDSK